MSLASGSALSMPGESGRVRQLDTANWRRLRLVGRCWFQSSLENPGARCCVLEFGPCPSRRWTDGGCRSSSCSRAGGFRDSSASETRDGLAMQGRSAVRSPCGRCGQVTSWAGETSAVAARVAAVAGGVQRGVGRRSGSTDVAIHAVSLEVEVGKAGEVLRLAERIDWWERGTCSATPACASSPRSSAGAASGNTTAGASAHRAGVLTLPEPGHRLAPTLVRSPSGLWIP